MSVLLGRRCLLPCAAILSFAIVFAAHAEEVKFDRQEIDGKIEIGYGLSLGRVDADELVDVLLADKREIVWYKNPGDARQPWTKHVIARELTDRDHVCIAARDIDGDGLVEIAVGANWNPGETTDVTRSGALFYLQRPADPTQPWDPIPIGGHDPTTHRMHWLKCHDGEMRLAVLPLHGIGNSNGEGATVAIGLYEVVENIARLHSKIDTGMHMTHNFELVEDPNGSGQELMIVAGKEGYNLFNSQGDDMSLVDDSLSKGAGEVRVFDVDDRSFVGIEPMHGTDVALYRHGQDGPWTKQEVDASLRGGHALATANLAGDDAPEIVAGWREPDEASRVGVKVYSRKGVEWHSHLIDDNQMACEDLKLCDFNGDGKIDIVAAGRATKNVVIYWNRSQ